MILVVAIAASLWFASPVKAVEVSLPNLPSTMYTSSSYSFYAQVDINTNESIPATSFRLDITGPTSAFVVFNLDGTITSQSGHFTSVTQVVSPYYGYSYRFGYGYGYQPPPTGYRYFTHSWGYGYGYGYGYGSSGTTQAKYLITLNTTNMSVGSYQAQLALNVTPTPKKFLSPQYSFTISALPGGGGGAPAPAAPVTPGLGVANVSDIVDSQGVFTQSAIAKSEDGKLNLTIDEGTKGNTQEGKPLAEISIAPMSVPPAPPADTAIVGLTYELGPNGATFDPAITLTFTFDPADIPEGVNKEDLVVAYWDTDTASWVVLEGSTVDPATNTITVPVSHFTAFTIMAYNAPAAFTISGLTISPAEVNVGESVLISATIANTGDLTDSYEAILKINNAVAAVKKLTVAGGTHQKVTFTVTKDTAGTYAVGLGGLSGTFTVKAPPAPPVTPLTPPAPPAPVPPPAPAPPVTPPPALPTAPFNWWLIGGIIAGIIVAVIIIWIIVRRREIS